MQYIVDNVLFIVQRVSYKMEAFDLSVLLYCRPSRDTWSMAEMLWQSVQEYLFIYLFILLSFVVR